MLLGGVTAGRLSSPDFLTFVEGFAGERDHAVWQAVLISLRGLGRFLGDEDYPRFQARIAALLRPAVADLGDPTPGEDDSPASCAACSRPPGRARRRSVHDRARPPSSTSSVAAPGSVHPELVAAATSVVASTGGADDFDRLFDAYKNASTPQDELRHLYALAEFDDEALLLRTCELCFGGDVKTQNAPFVLRSCIANRRHGAAAWTYVRQRWDDATASFPDNSIVRMVDSVKLLTDPPVVADVQGFFAEHPIPQAAKTLDQILERQRVNAAANARERPASLLPSDRPGRLHPDEEPRYSRGMRRIVFAFGAVPAAIAVATVPPDGGGGVDIVRQQATDAATDYFSTAVEGGASHVVCETPQRTPPVSCSTASESTAGAPRSCAGDDQRSRDAGDLRHRHRHDGDGADDDGQPGPRLGAGNGQPGGPGRPDQRADDRRRHP